MPEMKVQMNSALVKMQQCSSDVRKTADKVNNNSFYNDYLIRGSFYILSRAKESQGKGKISDIITM